MEQHTRHPGSLYDSTLDELLRFLWSRSGAEGVNMAEGSNVWLTYLQSILGGKVDLRTLPAETQQELKTLAEALSKLGQGDLGSLSDILAQRFKALELSALGQTSLAAVTQVIQDKDLGLMTPGEHAEAEKALAAKARISSPSIAVAAAASTTNFAWKATSSATSLAASGNSMARRLVP